MNLVDSARAGDRRAPFAAGISGTPRDVFQDRGRIKAFATGTVVFTQDSPCSALYQVKSGLLGLRRYTADGRRVVVRVARPGDVIGWSEALYNAAHRWEGWAFSSGRLCAVPASAWMQAQGGAARERLLGLAYQESLLLENALARLAALTAEERLLSFLLSLADCPDRYPVAVRIPVRRIYVSEIVSITPESCSRSLARLAKEGAIEWRDHDTLLISEAVARRITPLVEQFWHLPAGADGAAHPPAA